MAILTKLAELVSVVTVARLSQTKHWFVNYWIELLNSTEYLASKVFGLSALLDSNKPNTEWFLLS